MTKHLSLFLFLIGMLLNPLSLHAQNSPAASLQISGDFDNGSLGGWIANASGEIVLTHAPNSGEVWYHFRVDGVEGKTLTFVFENARIDFYGGDSLPAISYDQENWEYLKKRWIQPHTNDLNRVRYSFTHTFAANRAWLAFAPPYVNQRLDRLIAEISTLPHVSVESICQTPIKNLSIPLIVITDPETPITDKHGVLFLAREEALECASSWLCDGLIHFLLSDDPVAAALKRRCVFLIVPLFDRDGVALGSAVHPLSAQGTSVFWTETWPETSYSFFEQRQLKRFLQSWKDSGKPLHESFRIHSNGWSQDYFRREHCSDSNLAVQESLFSDILCKKYLPWYRSQDRVLQDTRFSKFVVDLFPHAIAGLCECEFRYENAFGLLFSLYKTTDDLRTEGELLAYGLADFLGIPASDPPPFLHAAEIYQVTGKAGQLFHARCVYRDLLNRPPQFVRIMVGEQAYDLQPVHSENSVQDWHTGVLYTGYVESKETVGSHYFLTSNGSRTTRIPHTTSRIGPILQSTTLQKRK